HAKAFGIDQIGFRRKADEPDAVPAEQELGREQRAIGRAHDQKLASRRHHAPPHMAQAYLGRAASASMRRSFSPAGDASGPAEPMQCESRDPAAASVST